MRLAADVALNHLINEVVAVADELESQAQGCFGAEEAVMLRMSVVLRKALKLADEKR